MSHVRGPWYVEGDLGYQVTVVNEGALKRQGEQRFICDVRGPHIYYGGEPDKTIAANAKLIAAAPELLEALERLLDACEEVNLNEWENNSNFFDEQKIARAVIEKAKS